MPDGKVYVEERTKIYDYERKEYRILKTKSLGILDPETGEIVPARHKVSS